MSSPPFKTHPYNAGRFFVGEGGLFWGLFIFMFSNPLVRAVKDTYTRTLLPGQVLFLSACLLKWKACRLCMRSLSMGGKMRNHLLYTHFASLADNFALIVGSLSTPWQELSILTPVYVSRSSGCSTPPMIGPQTETSPFNDLA